jgi:hypothetical protein
MTLSYALDGDSHVSQVSFGVVAVSQLVPAALVGPAEDRADVSPPLPSATVGDHVKEGGRFDWEGLVALGAVLVCPCWRPRRAKGCSAIRTDS